MTPNPAPRIFALLPCAGTGSRAGTATPKQYQLLNGQPLVTHTLAAFKASSKIAQVNVVVAPSDEWVQSACAEAQIHRCGGKSRAESVLNGLLALKGSGAHEQDWVLVHDAARCLISREQIDGLIEACANDEVGGLLALKLPDTLKSEIGGRVASTLDRSDKWLAQTPQMFKVGALLEALQAQSASGFAGVTDEASAMEMAGYSPKLVSASAQNFKVTYPEDFALAEAVLRSRT